MIEPTPIVRNQAKQLGLWLESPEWSQELQVWSDTGGLTQDMLFSGSLEEVDAFLRGVYVGRNGKVPSFGPEMFA